MTEKKRENDTEDGDRQYAMSGGHEGGGLAWAGVTGPEPPSFVPQALT